MGEISCPLIVAGVSPVRLAYVGHVSAPVDVRRPGKVLLAEGKAQETQVIPAITHHQIHAKGSKSNT